MLPIRQYSLNNGVRVKMCEWKLGQKLYEFSKRPLIHFSVKHSHLHRVLVVRDVINFPQNIRRWLANHKRIYSSYHGWQKGNIYSCYFKVAQRATRHWTMNTLGNQVLNHQQGPGPKQILFPNRHRFWLEPSSTSMPISRNSYHFKWEAIYGLIKICLWSVFEFKGFSF